MANEYAGEGQIYVCGACGKRSRDIYGEQAIDSGWDESCMLNAVLCHEASYRRDDNGIHADAVKQEPPR